MGRSGEGRSGEGNDNTPAIRPGTNIHSSQHGFTVVVHLDIRNMFESGCAGPGPPFPCPWVICPFWQNVGGGKPLLRSKRATERRPCVTGHVEQAALRATGRAVRLATAPAPLRSTVCSAKQVILLLHADRRHRRKTSNSITLFQKVTQVVGQNRNGLLLSAG